MIKLLIRFVKSRFVKLLIRTAGSLASAVIVISGYLAFLNFSEKYQKDTDAESEDSESVEGGIEE